MGSCTCQEKQKDSVSKKSLTFYIDAAVLRPARQRKQRGRPRSFSLPLIQFLLILKMQYKISYRDLEEFAKDVLLLFHHINLPSYSLICRRAVTTKLDPILPKLKNSRTKVVRLDATGVKVFRKNTWEEKLVGKFKHRSWIKICIDTNAHDRETIQINRTEEGAECTIRTKLKPKYPK